jgi:hypothetical protein
VNASSNAVAYASFAVNGPAPRASSMVRAVE